MQKPNILIKKKLLIILIVFSSISFLLFLRVFYIQTFKAEFLQKKAYEQQTRDRVILSNRGNILDRNMQPIATTQTVSSISVIHNQIENIEEVCKILSKYLDMDYEEVFKKASKKVALERIKTKVDKEIADKINLLNIKGIVIDEDIKRIYPYSNMASQVIGFVGRDNQGIIGLESKYEEYLKGKNGKILTETDVKGLELEDSQKKRQEPVDGFNLITSIDIVIQQYAEQILQKVIDIKGAKRGSIIVMNPQNGEIYAMANKPDFDLNNPFKINNKDLEEIWDTLSDKEKNDSLNKMWRNFSINDTYEPGSTFKIFTSSAGLEEGIINLNSMFHCGGIYNVAGRQIRCWRYPRSHGSLNFVEGVKNSCNPVFIQIAEKLGKETFYKYIELFGFKQKTGIDVPGEAVSIMHNINKVGPVELATMSFGQSFQITPLQLLRGACSVVNGGYLVVPHFATKVVDSFGNIIKIFDYENKKQIISDETSDKMREVLELVVYEGTGNKTYIPGYKIGGKTATSEKLPRRSGKYIASFMSFAPADDPKVIALVLIDEPQGVYYGGQVAGPVMKELLENILPYLKIKPKYNEEELKLDEVTKIEIPRVIGLSLNEAKKILTELKLDLEIEGNGDVIIDQFPKEGDLVNKQSKIKLYF